MADISETAPILPLPPDHRRRQEQRPKKDEQQSAYKSYDQAPDGGVSDVTTIMGIPAGEMTPKVQEVLSGLMAQYNKLRNELEGANAHNQYLEQLAEKHAYLPVINRRGLHRELSRVLAMSTLAEINNTFVCFHVRNIEDIRRRYGHGAVEAGLTWVAELLGQHIRDADVLGSMGGNDFGVILTLSAGEDASAKAASLAAAVEAGTLPWNGHVLPFEIAYGLHTFEENDTAETLMDKADENLLRRESGEV